MSKRLFFCVWFALAACAPTRIPATATVPRNAGGPIQHVVLVTIDGLMPETYLKADAHGLRVPTLRRFVAEGAYSEGALSAFPSVTYPSHTNIATGVRPARHGIVSNRRLDPQDKNQEAWYWYAEELKAKPIWDAALEAGYETALINWPVTVGAKATWLLPEYWRAKQPDDLKLLRALSTPGLADRVEQRFPGYLKRAVPPEITDQAGVDVASSVLLDGKPGLLMLHIFEVDSAQHKHGLWSPEAIAAIEQADAQLARLIAAVASAGILDSTAFVFASDHGFAPISRQINPSALLREAGLIAVDEKSKVQSYKAATLASGGLAYVYLAEPSVEAQVGELLMHKASEPGSGIARVFDRTQIAEKGGDPTAVLALEAELGVAFGNGVASYEGMNAYVATHGYDPERPEMKASLLLLGPSVKHGVLAGARLIDIAPTIAHWLSLSLPDVEGRSLQ